MSTEYRVLVRCDEQASGECYGLLEVTLAEPREIDYVGTRLWQQGWRRGYRADSPATTYDVCPACRPAVEARLAEPVNEKGRADG